MLLHAETYLHLLPSLKRFGMFKNLTWKRLGNIKTCDRPIMGVQVEDSESKQ